ncbi:MAG: hypothetical protein AAF404_15350, partial [Pseudomonadota bacterium]
ISPTAGEIADAVRARIPGVELTFRSDPARQAILDSWPQALDDSKAREDWGWQTGRGVYLVWSRTTPLSDNASRVRDWIVSCVA